jgi:protein-S-isoprenylcysteine O-methyltransferase Ste14
MRLTEQTTVISFLLAECATILAMRSPGAPWAKTILRYLVPRGPGAHHSLVALTSLSNRFLAGAALMVSSAALRVWCYRTLGSLFTFEVSIKPEHKLVTSGPYAYVRHPSYTAVGLMMAGAVACISSPDGYARHSGVADTVLGRWWLWTWYVLSAFSVLSLGKRGRVEDDALRKEFGGQWEQYRARVPYKFVPGLL